MNIRTEALSNITKKHDTQVKLAEFMLKDALSHKDVDKLYKKCRGLQLDIAKAEYLGKDVTTLKNKLSDTKKELYAALNKHGISREQLKVKYNCSICHDKGVINGKDCECLKREISEILLEKSGINKNNLPKFSDVYFKVFGDNEKNMRKVYETMQSYCALENTTRKIVTLTGQVGVGKTYLIECMVNEYIKQSKYVIYTTAYSLNADMLKYHTTSLNERADIMQKYFDCDVLFIDDLGTENILRNVTCEYLFQLLNERTRKGKQTIITTNLDLQQIIEVYDERIFSRLVDQNNCLVIKLDGKDLRTIKK